MAEVNETQPIVAQPVQPVQPAKVFILDSITLKGADIYGKMKPFSSNAREYASDKMSGETYYLYRFAGTIITVPAKFHNAYEAFEVLEVTLTGGVNPREMADPSVPGGKKVVDTQSYGLDGYLTTDDDIAMLKIQKHIAQVQRAKKTIQKIDVTKEMSDKELNEIMGNLIDEA